MTRRAWPFDFWGLNLSFAKLFIRNHFFENGLHAKSAWLADYYAGLLWVAQEVLPIYLNIGIVDIWLILSLK